MRWPAGILVAGFGLILLAIPAGAALPREPAGAPLSPRVSTSSAFDLWRGVWKSGLYYLTLKTFSGGQVRGVFGEEAADLSSAQVDWPGYDFRGEIAPDGSRVTGVVVSGTAGDIAAELSVADVAGFRWLLLTQFAYRGGPELDVGTYGYIGPAGSAGDRARLAFDRTWEIRRDGEPVRGPARVGDVVRLVFDVEGQGPRGLEPEVVALDVKFPKALAPRVDVVESLSDDVRCTRGRSDTAVFFRCLLGALGPPDATARVVVDARVPASLKNKFLMAKWGFARVRKLAPALAVEVDDAEGRVKIRIRPGKPGSGGNAGGGEEEEGGGGNGDGGGSQPPPLTPVTEELLKELVCVDVTIGGDPMQLVGFGGFNPDIQSGFVCSYANQIGASVGGIQVQYTRVPGGASYCRDFDSDDYLSRTNYNVQVMVPSWFDNAAALRAQILTRLENAGIALPCPR